MLHNRQTSRTAGDAVSMTRAEFSVALITWGCDIRFAQLQSTWNRFLHFCETGELLPRTDRPETMGVCVTGEAWHELSNRRIM